MSSEGIPVRISRVHRRVPWMVGAGLAAFLGFTGSGVAAVVECASGDVACLIGAINVANASGGANTIRLQRGTYTLQAPDNATDGSNGLPSITSQLTIIGAGASHTIIERAATAPNFRLFHVGQTGLLKLERLSARFGRVPVVIGFGGLGGAGLLNRGTAILSQSALTNNQSGGILSFGRLVIAGSTISSNVGVPSGGGVTSAAGLLTVLDSTISGNSGASGGGLYIADGVTAIIIGSTIADNRATDADGGGLFSDSPAVAIINSTLAGNRADSAGGGFAGKGGIIVNTTIGDNHANAVAGDGLQGSAASPPALYNTIVTGMVPVSHPACGGPTTSLGNNLFTDDSCAVPLLEDDLIGNPRLGGFTDDGTPGHGFLPLLPGSPAINAGDNAACLPADQIGHLRRGRNCDIGAIEGKARRDHDDP